MTFGKAIRSATSLPALEIGRSLMSRSAPTRARTALTVVLAAAVSAGLAGAAPAQDLGGIMAPDPVAQPPLRPSILANRWQESWSVLADPARRTEPLDQLKYRPVGVGDAFVTLGATLRERLEINQERFGLDGSSDAYRLQRLQLHADTRIGAHWRAFVQLEDVRAPGKRTIGAADQNRLDLRLAFVAYENPTPNGAVKARLGRQEFAFDLQRFVSSRDGPNVRQAFDAVWADWEAGPWRIYGFLSQPVRYEDGRAFDDASSGALRFHMVRIERHILGVNELSAYYARYARSVGRHGDAIGREDRDILDARTAGSLGAVDWDLEAMIQRGSVGSARIRAWALGARGGYTLETLTWRPRLGLQWDAASGDEHKDDRVLGSFNPLFPNGAYFTRAGHTGYVNLTHLRPSITVRPMARLSIEAAVAGQWRRTIRDAIYTSPSIAVPGSRGTGKAWTGAYGQLHADYVFNSHLTGSIEAVRYEVGATLAALGGRDSDYLGVELKFGW